MKSSIIDNILQKIQKPQFIVVFIILLILQNSVFIWNFLQYIPLGYDSFAYTAASRALRQNQTPYLPASDLLQYLPETSSVPPYIYPPTLALLLMPIAHLPLEQFTLIWIGFLFIITIVFTLAIRHHLGTTIAVIAVFGFTPTIASLLYGQVNPLISLLLWFALPPKHLPRFRSQLWAGVLYGFGALIKITPIIPAGLLSIRKQWGVGLGFAFITLTIIVLNLKNTSINLWIDGMIYPFLISEVNLWCISYTAYIARLPIPFNETIATILSALFLLITCWKALSIHPRLAFAATTILPLLIARIVWEHHAMMILPALLVLWMWSQRGRKLAIGAWLLITFVGYITIPLALTCCWIACCWPQLIEDQANPNDPMLA